MTYSMPRYYDNIIETVINVIKLLIRSITSREGRLKAVTAKNDIRGRYV